MQIAQFQIIRKVPAKPSSKPQLKKLFQWSSLLKNDQKLRTPSQSRSACIIDSGDKLHLRQEVSPYVSSLSWVNFQRKVLTRAGPCQFHSSLSKSASIQVNKSELDYIFRTYIQLYCFCRLAYF